MIREIKENTEMMLLPREARDAVQKGWVVKRMCPKFNRNENSRSKQRKYFVSGRVSKEESTQ